jgi:hypothetical protein
LSSVTPQKLTPKEVEVTGTAVTSREGSERELILEEAHARPPLSLVEAKMCSSILKYINSDVKQLMVGAGMSWISAQSGSGQRRPSLIMRTRDRRVHSSCQLTLCLICAAFG